MAEESPSAEGASGLVEEIIGNGCTVFGCGSGGTSPSFMTRCLHTHKKKFLGIIVSKSCHFSWPRADSVRRGVISQAFSTVCTSFQNRIAILESLEAQGKVVDADAFKDFLDYLRCILCRLEEVEWGGNQRPILFEIASSNPCIPGAFGGPLPPISAGLVTSCIGTEKADLAFANTSGVPEWAALVHSGAIFVPSTTPVEASHFGIVLWQPDGVPAESFNTSSGDDINFGEKYFNLPAEKQASYMLWSAAVDCGSPADAVMVAKYVMGPNFAILKPSKAMLDSLASKPPTFFDWNPCTGKIVVKSTGETVVDTSGPWTAPGQCG